ncbi:MAG: hypothetical protein H7196_02430 [candidate division SR1 bacterium]|nr:hypothetical protein [candidate division SR1 bacterium]
MLVVLLGGFVIAGLKGYEWYDDRFLDDKIGGWFTKQNYIFVQLFPPGENLRSMQEMESFYVNLSSIYSGKSKKDIYLEGKWYENFTFEVHSRGGQVSFYVYLNKNYLPLLRSSLASHYPGSTVVEVPDPLLAFPKKWEGKAGPYNHLFTTDIGFGASDLFPLKSWKMFQMGSNSPITDPMTTLISNFENIEAEDYIILQFVLQPQVYSPDKKKALATELKKLREDYKANANIEIGPDSSIQVLTKQERAVLESCEQKLTTTNFKMKIRTALLSVNPAPQRNLGMIMSFFKEFNTEVQFTKPDADTKTSAAAEGIALGPFQDKYYWKKEQDYRRLNGYKAILGRGLGRGSDAKFMDVESLASLFHFPATEMIDQSLASRVSTDYGNVNALPSATPPSNLPI